MACVSVGKQSCSSDETRTPYQIVGGFFFFVQRNKYCKELCECGLTLRFSLCSISVGIISNRECICACACTDAFSLFLCILNALKKTLKIIISEIMANNIKPSEWSHRQFLFSFPFRLLLTGINLSETIPETLEFEQIVLHSLEDSLLGCVYLAPFRWNPFFSHLHELSSKKSHQIIVFTEKCLPPVFVHPLCPRLISIEL